MKNWAEQAETQYAALAGFAEMRQRELLPLLEPYTRVTDQYGAMVCRIILVLGQVPPETTLDSMTRDLTADVFDFLHEGRTLIERGMPHLVYPLARRAFESLCLVVASNQNEAAIGLAPLGSSMIPAVFAERAALNRRAGRIVTEAVLRGTPVPRDIVTRKALENACAVVAATGGSTNAVLHIPAIANEAGIDFDIDHVASVFARTPLIGNLQPGGKYLARDIYEIGGAPVVLRETDARRPPPRRCAHYHGPHSRGGTRRLPGGRWRDRP